MISKISKSSRNTKKPVYKNLRTRLRDLSWTTNERCSVTVSKINPMAHRSYSQSLRWSRTNYATTHSIIGK